jgi:hypothetical protein
MEWDMESLKEQIEMLKLVANDLGDSKSFAYDLISSYEKYKSLTPKQEAWVMKLIDRATQPVLFADPKPTKQLADFSGVVELFKKAQAHLKYPKINLKLPDLPIVLTLAGSKSKAPGTVNVAGEGKYPDREWYGRVNVKGEWEPSRSVSPTLVEPLTELLMELAADPGGVAAKYGKLTGNCCFCNSGLEDPRSTAAGFGPVCAEHFGLKEQWKKATEGVAA